MENEEVKPVEVVEEVEEVETPEADLTPETDWEAEAKKARGIVQRLRTKLTKATEKKVEEKSVVQPKPKTGGLDEMQLDYLDLKGISDSEDVAVIEGIVKKTGMTVRQALKDDYVLSKLEANKKTREVQNATPGASNRGTSQPNNLAAAIAKFERTGELPTDFALRTQIVNSIADSGRGNKPSWHQ